MSNAVDICNLALANLGEQSSLVSIDPPEGSSQAEKLARFYPIALRFMLSTRNWVFATKREVLTEHVSCDRENWLHCYALPAGCIQVVRVANPVLGLPQPDVAGWRDDYETGLNAESMMCLYTNIPEAEVTYVTEKVNPAAFSPAFTLALAWKLSSMLAGSLIGGSEGSTMTSNCDKMMQQYLAEASRQDATQNRKILCNVIPQFILHRE
jgi:hypothetical protein